ncbi:serine hydrolase domain-containing protein [Legionella hackeliae]|uniref:Putative D-stereospecific peptide hydrolase n=1 Tax=Legionella hackeliae TaxID=449 RepID=A0A0A8UQ53_LEGHA|nr:serine hydrolase domain-containing protein [Legionella hackeliae]KTD12894.1 D-alanyl-D-alanine carboxypeptidase [Legionella hackeliae]CEK09202.1 putative D-stereospecific peptide hydrolase [Legionella hackeliae]STX49110.1 D-alanyl-D-alanine carboxypeptidase [Legionella hackeliae]
MWHAKYVKYPLFFLLSILGFAENAYCLCPSNINEIQTVIDFDRLKYNIPGIEASISCRDGESPHDFVSGTTTLDKETPVNAAHLFQVGSETKSFIATILLQMESEGLLSIHDHLSNYFENLPETWQAITIEQLLNHSSGLFNYTDVLEEMGRDSNFDFSKDWSSQELIELVIDKPLYFPPGGGWHYSNTNYVLAGLIIEKVTGHSLNEAIESRLTSPLQLTNTYYLPTVYNRDILDRMAHGYSVRGYFPDEPRDITYTSTSWANAAGAIVATSHDMAIWFRHLMQGSLLAPQQMRELTTTVEGTLPRSTQKIGYGLGVMYDEESFGEQAWWHSGGTLGYSALMVWLKNRDIVITVNINHVSATKDIYGLMKDLAKFIQDSQPGMS